MNKLKLTVAVLILISKLSYSQTETIKYFKTEPQKLFLEQYLKDYRKSANIIDDKLLASLDLEDFLSTESDYETINNPTKNKLTLTGVIEMKDTNDMYEIVMQFEQIKRTDYSKQTYDCSLFGKINDNDVSFEGNMKLRDIKKNKGIYNEGNYYLCTYDFTFNSADANVSGKPIRTLQGVYVVSVRMDTKALKTFQMTSASGDYSDMTNIFVGTLTKREKDKTHLSKVVFGDKFYTPIVELPLVNFNAIFEEPGKFKPTMKERFKNINKMKEYNW